MFEKFAGFGELINKPNQSIEIINKHSSIIYLRKVLKTRQIRLGFGDCLSLQISYDEKEIFNDIGDHVNDEEKDEDRNLLIMFNLHNQQELFEIEFRSSSKVSTYIC
jgi:hypothetical protein